MAVSVNEEPFDVGGSWRLTGVERKEEDESEGVGVDEHLCLLEEDATLEARWAGHSRDGFAKKQSLSDVCRQSREDRRRRLSWEVIGLVGGVDCFVLWGDKYGGKKDRDDGRCCVLDEE